MEINIKKPQDAEKLCERCEHVFNIGAPACEKCSGLKELAGRCPMYTPHITSRPRE